MTCNPDICPNCQYIGEGDSLCDVLQEIVLDNWMATKYFMAAGCPYLQRRRKKKRRRRVVRKRGR